VIFSKLGITQAEILATLAQQEAEVMKQQPKWIKTDITETKMISNGLELEHVQ
jgi:hypothetical protein